MKRLAALITLAVLIFSANCYGIITSRVSNNISDAYEAVLNSMIPQSNILIYHIDGTVDSYEAAADTNVARGNALISAVSAVDDYDTILIVGNCYIGSSKLNFSQTTGVTVMGINANASTIEGATSIIHVGKKFCVSDLTIKGRLPITDGNVIPFGSFIYNDGLTFERLNLISTTGTPTDTMIITGCNDVIIRDVNVLMNWDGIRLGGNNILLDNVICRRNEEGTNPNPGYAIQQTSGDMLLRNFDIQMYYTGTRDDKDQVSITVSSGATATLINGYIQTSQAAAPSRAIDIEALGTVTVAGVVYDPTRTTGAIINADIEAGRVNATGYAINGTDGWSGSFAADGNTITVASGLITSKATVPNMVGGERLLATVDNVNMNTGAVTTLYTVPAGTTLYVTKVIVVADTNLAGCSSVTFTNLGANKSLTKMTTPNDYFVVLAPASGVGVVPAHSISSGGNFQITINSGATIVPAVAKMMVFGILE